MYPGNFSNDALSQWLQVTGANYMTDWHPVIHTMLMRFSSTLYASPFSLVLIQTIATSAIYASAFTYLRKMGLSSGMLYVVAVLIAFVPTNGYYMATLYKDILFAIAMLALAVILGKISLSEKKPTIQESLLLILAIFCVAGFRHDGIVPATIGAVLAGALYFKRMWRLLPLVGIIAVVFLRLVVYPAVGIQPTSAALSNGIPLHAIASVFYREGDIGERYREILTEHIPAEKWAEDYDPFTPNSMAYPATQPAIAFVVSEHVDRATILRAYFDVLARNPLQIVRHHLSNSDIRWAVFQSHDPAAFYRTYIFSRENYGFIRHHNLTWFRTLELIIESTGSPVLGNILLWRTGVWVILSALLLYVLWLRGLFRYAVMALPLASAVMFGVIFTGHPDSRYTYSVFLCFPVILLFFMAAYANHKERQCDDKRKDTMPVIGKKSILLMIKYAMPSINKKSIVSMILALFTLGIVFLRILLPNVIFTGWIIAFILALGWGFMLGIKFRRNYSLKAIAGSLICIVAISALVSVPYHSAIQGNTSTFVTVTATGEKNDASHSSEVWVSFTADGFPVYLAQHEFEEWWPYLGSNTTIVSTQGSFTLELPAFSNLRISFVAHPWSGIVEVTTPAGTQRHDLFREEPQVFSLDTPFVPINGMATPRDFALDFLFILAAAMMVNCVVKYFRKSHIYIVFGFVFGMLLTSSIYTRWDFYSQVLFIFLCAFLAGKFIPLFTSGKWREYAPTIQKQIVLTLIIIYATFASTYNQIVMATIPWQFTISSLGFIMLFAIFWTIVAFAVLHGLEWATNKRLFIEKTNFNAVLFWVKVFCIIMLGFSLWIIPMYPANLSPDSINQWNQATGVWPLNDWHPVIHTMLIRLSLVFYESPFSLILIQSLVTSAIYASTFVYLRKTCLSSKILYIFAILIALAPPNGFHMATFWKDVGFSVAMLGLAVILGKISLNEKKPTIQERLLLIFAIFCVVGFRHDGIVPATIGAVLAGCLYFKRIWRFLPLVGIIAVVFLRSTVYPAIGIEPTPAILSNSMPLHAIASVFYREGDIGERYREILTEHIPVDKWVEDYNPFTPNPLGFPTTQPAIGFVVSEHVDSVTIVRAYIDVFVRNPLQIIRHHLSNSDIRWAVFQSNDPQAFNYVHFVNRNHDNFGFAQNHNQMPRLESILVATFRLTLGNILLWRTGVWVILSALLLYTMWLRGLFRYTVMALPLASSVMAGVIFNGSSDYRYTYSVFLCFPAILLFFLATRTNYRKSQGEDV